MVGFEPTISSTPSWRIARLSHILNQSVQGDSNPRIHHGKVAGCQATSWTQAVPGVGVEPTLTGSEPVGLPVSRPRNK